MGLDAIAKKFFGHVIWSETDLYSALVEKFSSIDEEGQKVDGDSVIDKLLDDLGLQIIFFDIDDYDQHCIALAIKDSVSVVFSPCVEEISFVLPSAKDFENLKKGMELLDLLIEDNPKMYLGASLG